MRLLQADLTAVRTPGLIRAGTRCQVSDSCKAAVPVCSHAATLSDEVTYLFPPWEITS